MFKAGIVIVATLLVAAEGLKCNKCFYADGDGIPEYKNGQRVASYRFDDSCDWKEDVKSTYSGVECRKIGTVDPVCVVFRLEGEKKSDGQLVIRDCYNQQGGVSDSDLDGCKEKGLVDFMLGTMNPEFDQFYRELIGMSQSRLVNKTMNRQADGNVPTDVCLCKEDNCNSGASVITVSFFMIAAVASALYNFA